ncbi:MAG: PDZ domain-containing protein [Chitinophagales bacterium]
MKNSHIRLIIGLMAFSMLGLSFLQYQWIQETKATKQAQFDLTINDVMDKVAQKIEKLEAASMITKNFPKPKREYIEALVQHPEDEKNNPQHSATSTHNSNTSTVKNRLEINTKIVRQFDDPTHYTPEQKVYHAIIGLELSLDKAQKSEYGTGLYVEKVETNGIAATAGIEEGDILLGINGTPLSNHLDLKRRVNQLSEKDDVFFTFARNGMVKTTPSVLESDKIKDPNHNSNRLFLGVYCKDAKTDESDVSQKGVLVTDVISNTTADDAGLQKEDILVGIGKESIYRVKDIKEALSHHNEGDKVAITFWRSGKEYVNYAQLKATEEEDANVNWKVSSAAVRIQTYIQELNKLDKSLSELDEMYKDGGKNKVILGVHLSEFDNLEGGVMINDITEDGPADKAGLLKNDILTSVNSQPIRNIADLREALKDYVPGDEISIGFKRRKEEQSHTESIITSDYQKIIIAGSIKTEVASEANEVETLAKLMNREDMLWAHIEKQLNDVYSLIIEKWMVDIPLQERVRPELLENTLAAFLEDAGIDIPYEYCLASNGEVIYSKSADQFGCTQQPDIYRKKLFTDAVYSQPGELLLHFPEQDKYILRSSAMMLGSSILFNLIIIFTFAYTIHTILRQKKLSEMKTDFINNMTHELKTPISTIKLVTEMLTDKTLPKTSNSIDRYANMINEENDRLESHVEKVLQYARIEKDTVKLNFVAVEMHEIILEAIQKIGLQVSKKGGTINCSLDALQSVVQGDQLHLTNVVYNLLDNANKYSEGAPDIHVYTHTTSEGLAVAVTDKGIGMTKETLKRIFDKFYRVPTGNIHNVKGFGLGLSYVKSMVEAHGGTVTARSKINKGSTIEFTLPIKD